MHRFTLEGPHGKMLAELTKPTTSPAPLIVFAHGFKGFMDWGHFPLVAEEFGRQGFAFLRFNFSHNGTTLDKPTEFADLERFGHNTYEKEITELNYVVNYVGQHLKDQVDADRIYLLGHSRGGGIAMITAGKNRLVKKVVTWAGVGTLVRFSKEELAEWQQKGVLYIKNSRTNQQMPIYLDLMNDYRKNQKEYQLQKVGRALTVPYLQIHGTEDSSVPLDEARSLRLFNYDMEWEEIEGANHTLGGAHPWDSKELPKATLVAIKHTVSFLKNKK